MDCLSLVPVIQNKITTARHAYDNLLQLVMSMFAPVDIGRIPPNIIDSPNIKRDVFMLLERDKLAAMIAVDDEI